MKIVEILLTNTGAEPFPLPVGRDGDAVLQANNRSRRELWFYLKEPQERFARILCARTYSSTDVAGALLALAPGDSVRVRFAKNLRENTQAWTKKGLSKIELQAGAEDSQYEDNPKEYVLNSPFPEAFSENRITLPLEP